MRSDVLRIVRVNGKKPKHCVFTVDGERGRRFRLAHHVLGHAGVGADVGGDETADLQGVIFTELVSGKQEGQRIRGSTHDVDKSREEDGRQGTGR